MNHCPRCNSDMEVIRLTEERREVVTCPVCPGDYLVCFGELRTFDDCSGPFRVDRYGRRLAGART